MASCKVIRPIGPLAPCKRLLLQARCCPPAEVKHAAPCGLGGVRGRNFLQGEEEVEGEGGAHCEHIVNSVAMCGLLHHIRSRNVGDLGASIPVMRVASPVSPPFDVGKQAAHCHTIYNVLSQHIHAGKQLAQLQAAKGKILFHRGPMSPEQVQIFQCIEQTAEFDIKEDPSTRPC